MQEIFDIISGAKQAVMFLLFQPGEPSIIGEASKAQKIDPDILVKGAITDPESRNQWDRVDLYHRTADMPDASVIDTSVISVAAVEDEFSFWRKELLKTSPYAHAVIHDKLIVIDPFSEDCVVVTGSHNLGNKASYSNDENLVIIKGNKLLAEAYLTHVIDVYDHYRWRFLLQQKHEAAFKNLDDTTSWQDKYFKPGSAAKREVDFWMSAIPMT
jgi:phosphatidylserine/phosphatidylglycerophosphate/cardiolipin synthase-like enzyme